MDTGDGEEESRLQFLVDALSDAEGGQDSEAVPADESSVDLMADYFPQTHDSNAASNLDEGNASEVDVVEGVSVPADSVGHREDTEETLAQGLEELSPVAKLLSSSRWGVFRITPKQPGSKGGGLYGGYEGTCCFHRKNDKTGCKKYVSIKGPEEADRDISFAKFCFGARRLKVARRSQSI